MSKLYPLGRLHAPDERDGKFKMASILKAPPTSAPKTKTWRTGIILDQGAHPHCVGYAWKQFLQSSPLRTKTGPTGTEIYKLAQTLDEWPGENYDGTSVRGGAKALAQLNHLASYYWADGVEDVQNFVLTSGPVVVGTAWYTSMFTVKPNGYVDIDGSVAGGHAWLIVGYNSSRNAFRACNSWGESWGQKGKFWIKKDALSQLLNEMGEACAAVEK